MRKSIAAATTAVIAAALATAGYNAPAPADHGLVGLDEVSLDTLLTAQATTVHGRASGRIEQFYLDGNGEVESLRIRWTRGLLDDGFDYVQPASRFAFNPDRGLIRADASIDTIEAWAEDDARLEAMSGGISAQRVYPSVLNGSAIRSDTGDMIGRVVDFEYGATGELTAIIYVERAGLFRQMRRTRIGADRVRWHSRDRELRIVGGASA